MMKQSGILFRGKKIISLILITFLVGCGGGSSPASSTGATPEEKGDIQQKNKSYQTDATGKITTIKLSGSAEDIAVKKDALFVAKGKDGVDILNIGYNDTVKSEFITAIDGINARSVGLSDDGKKLYIVNEEGFVNIFDINDLSSPVKVRTTTQQEIKKEVTTTNGKYQFVPKGKDGLEIINVSEQSVETIFNKANAYDIVLASKDTQALIASGITGINLLDITKPTSPNMVVNFSVPGGTKGLSLNKEQGILFVANGDKGVLVYNLNTILDKLSK